MLAPSAGPSPTAKRVAGGWRVVLHPSLTPTPITHPPPAHTAPLSPCCQADGTASSCTSTKSHRDAAYLGRTTRPEERRRSGPPPIFPAAPGNPANQSVPLQPRSSGTPDPGGGREKRATEPKARGLELSCRRVRPSPAELPSAALDVRAARNSRHSASIMNAAG